MNDTTFDELFTIEYKLLFPPKTSGVPINNYVYYMASSASRQDEPNRMLWLRAMIVRCDGAILPAWDYLLYPASEFMDLDFVLVHKHTKKELGQYPAILTSHLVNNPYLLHQKLLANQRSCLLS